MSPTALDNVRVEVAFSADPNTTSPAFVDLTSRARLDAGIGITRGRQDEFSEASAGTCRLTFDNTDGALTPNLPSSPFYPNVKPQNRLRVTYRDPNVAGNLIEAESASFEGGTVGAWGTAYFGAALPVTLANSAVRASHGTKSLLITFPTAATACGAAVGGYDQSTLVKGRTYTAQCRVWVTAGVPAVAFGDAFGNTPTATSSTTGAWQTLIVTFVFNGAAFFVVRSTAATTAGQQVWVDSVMIDEGSTAAAFTTTPPPIRYRSDTYVDEWPTDWPTGGQAESTVSITAVDLQGRITRKRKLASVIAETYQLSLPLWHFPLSEPADSTTVGDRIGSGATLGIAQVGTGTGGTLTFAAGTGPGTDGSAAPVFAPASATAGKYLVGKVPGYSTATSGETHEVTFATTAAAVQTVARWVDSYGLYLDISTDAAGHLVGTYGDPWSGATLTVTSASVGFKDGATHTAAFSISLSGTTLTVQLFGDGVSMGTATTPSAAVLPVAFNTLLLGGTPTGRCFTGTISHAAGFGVAITAPTALEHYTAASTGFAGERSDQRIARILSWLGMPAGLQSLDVGQATIAHVDPTGRGAWDYMQDVATTEAGLLFASTDGKVTFYSRSRSYAVGAAVDVAVTAELISPDTRIVNNLAEVVNDVTVTRAGGAAVRVLDAASQSTYGVLDDSLELVSSSDSDAFDRANWILATRSTPKSRLPDLTLDGLTDASTSPSVRAIDLASRVQVTTMPSQSPTSTFDLRVQGYTETIGAGGWSVTANTTPYLVVRPLTLDDPVYGLLDSNSLVY